MSVYVGPYAMWVDTDPPEYETPELQPLADVLWGYWGVNCTARIEPEQEDVRVVFYVPAPRSSRPGGPARVFDSSASGCEVALELRDVDREAEVEAFRTAYKPELDLLILHFGRPPVLRWGLLYF